MNSGFTPNLEQPTIETATMTRPNRLPSDWRISVLVLIALWAVIYMAGLSHPALLDDADTVHAEAAREMLQRHDWVTLYANGVRYLEKAPLMYWGVATSYTLFGVSEWSTRFPLMLGVLAMILSTYGLGRWALGSEGGFDSGLVLATALGPFLFTRFLIPDVAVGLWLTLTFWLFLISLEQAKPARWTCWGIGAMCALNVLTKGLIGLVFPIGAIGLYLLLTGNLRHLLKLRLVSSALVFFAIAAPWHILAALRNPTQGNVRGFLWFYFVNEHILRFLNRRVPRDYDKVPLLLFWALLVLWLIPWTVFLPQSLREVPRRWREFRAQMTRRQRAYLLFSLWTFVIVGFFSLSTRQEYYTIPAIPGMALLVGGWLQRERASAKDSRERRSGMISSAVLLAVGVIIAVVGFALLFVSKAPATGTDLSDLLRKNPQDYALSFGHFLDLTPQAMGAFRVPLFGFSLAFLGGTLANWILRRRGRAGAGNVALVAMMVVLLACVRIAFGIFSPILSSKDLAMAIREQYRPGDQIVVIGLYENASSLNFYAGLPLHSLHIPGGNMWYGTQFPGAPRVFETQASFVEMWNGPRRVFLWAEEDDPPALRGLTNYVVARRGGKIIFSNQPNRPTQAAAALYQALSWLPADTETVTVARGPFVLTSPPRHDWTPQDWNPHQIVPDQELAQKFEDLPLVLFHITDPSLYGRLQGKRVAMAVEGSRHFRGPGGLGMMPFEGCAIVIFADDLGDDAGSLIRETRKGALRAEEILGQQVSVFQQKDEEDTWTTFVAFPNKNVVLVASDRDYMREVLARLQGHQGERALPGDLPEWKYVDSESPFWGLRHFDKSQAKLDPSSPFGGRKSANFPDEKAIGLTFVFDPSRGRSATITYLSVAGIGNTSLLAMTESRETKDLAISYHEIAPGVTQGSYTLKEMESTDFFLFLLDGFLGHGIYL